MAVITSLPTPPGTSHRDKDSGFPGSRVAWTQHNQYHILTSPKGPVPLPSTASRQLPTKSILKKSVPRLLIVQEEEQREATPEPEDPLVNLSYLTRPVSQILASETSFTDLIDAYAVLAARIRSAVMGTTDADASWPLFQPIRKNTQPFTDAVCRDLGKALVEPKAPELESETEDYPFACVEEEELPMLLPSPKQSPKKKKRGMSAGQAKYARDLCTTSHAVMRLLGAVFTLPAVYRVFTDAQLGEMLTAVLSIPLAEVLPTPNGRKTCALSIWLLQVQRLPEEVLVPASARIAFALRRGMEGELGKEGKKGSACDGLKAIHDLSVYQPSTFVPAFTELLPSILANLLAPTLLLRTQACHALGGFVLACVSIPQSSLQTRISKAVAKFLTNTTRSPEKKSPSKPSSDPVIVRTLRTTLNASDPQHAAQGPVWALSVIASFIVLLGPAVYVDVRLTRIISALLQLAVRNKKSSVRGLACVTWRCVAWAYFRPCSSMVSDEEVDLNDKDVDLLRENYWKLLKSITDMGAGVATVAALLGDDSDDEDRLSKALTLVKAMIKKGGQTCGDGMEIARILVSAENVGEAWSTNKLIPHSLFSSNPGLLTAEYKTLATAVRPILDECPQLTDVRSLTRDELSRSWVFDNLIDIWRSGLACLELPDDSGPPPEVLAIWEGLLKANVAVLQDEGDDDGTAEFATKAAMILVDILRDPKLDLSTKVGPPPPQHASPVMSRKPSLLPSRSNAALKLVVTRDLWTMMRTTFPDNVLHSAGGRLLACLIEDEANLVWETDSPDDARKQWAYFCAEVLVVCEVDDLREFWAERSRAMAMMSYEPGVQSLVWGCFIERWTEEAQGPWEGAALLLGVPFGKSSAWDMTSGEFETWDNFLQHAVNQALDYGVDSSAVLDRVAEIVSENPCPAYASSTRVADMLLTHLDMADVRQMPSYIFDFVNDTLQSTYPPEPRNKVTSIWMVRSLIRVVDACPVELRLNLLETLQEGISLWISDEFHAFNEDEYTGDMLPLYQTALLGMQELPRSVHVLDTLSTLIESVFHGRNDKPSIAHESFEEFWQLTFAHHEQPEGGWPQRIQACVKWSAPTPAVEDIPVDVFESISQIGESSSGSSSDGLGSDDIPYPSSQTSPGLASPFGSDKDGSPSSDSSPFIGRLGPAFFPTSPTATLETNSPLFPSLCYPTTPTQRQNRAATPPRPQKPSTTPESFHSLLLRSPASTLPLSPVPPSTPRRLPVKSEKTPCSMSPSKRRMLEDKENVSPVLTVVQRIANSSPGKESASSILGRRQTLDEPCVDDVTKKGRRASGTFIRSSIEFPCMDGDSDLEDELAVETSLLSPIRSSIPSLCLSSVTHTSKKRKRVVMDAVVLPSFQEVQNGWRMQRRASLERTIASTPTKVMRRTHSLPVLSDSERDESEDGRRKRMRLWDDSEATDEDEYLSSSPLKALEDIQMAGSDDSIMLTGSPHQPSEGSGDDLQAPQMPPQHLVSPAPRRIGHDLPSDPLSSSPSRDLVIRRRNRMLSLSEKPSITV